MPRMTGYYVNDLGRDDYERQLERIRLETDGLPFLYRGEEIYEGPKRHKLYVDALAEDHKEGDSILMDTIMRVSGDANASVDFYMKCLEKGIHLRFLDEPWLDTSIYETVEDHAMLRGLLLRMLDKYYKGISEDKRVSPEERYARLYAINPGLAETVRNGRVLSESERARKAKEFILEKSRDFNGCMLDKDIMEIMPVSITRSTYYRYKAQLVAAYGKKSNKE